MEPPPPPSSSSTTTTNTLLEKLAGVWERIFLQEPLMTGPFDRTTLVLWTQTPKSGIYVDLRLPQHSPGRAIGGNDCGIITKRPSAILVNGYSDENKKILLDDSNKTTLGALLSQESFAGRLQVTEGDTTKTKGVALTADTVFQDLIKKNTNSNEIPFCTCYWRRLIDCQPLSKRLDIGICASQRPCVDGSIYMRETGDDASYAEGWLKLADSTSSSTNSSGAGGKYMALELQSEIKVSSSDDGTTTTTTINRVGYWIRTQNRFAYAVGYPTSEDDATALGVPIQAAQIRSKENTGKSFKELLFGSSDSTTKKRKRDEDSSSEGKDDDDDVDDILDIHGSYVALSGIITDDGKWLIQYSTNPELCGCNLVGSGGDGEDDSNDKDCCSYLDTTAMEDDDEDDDDDDDDTIKIGDVVYQYLVDDGGRSASKTTRTWKVVELSSNCTLPIFGSGIDTQRTVYGMDPHPDFVNVDLPRSFPLPSFTFTKLSPKEIKQDYDAVTSSTEILKGLFGTDWPTGLTKENNMLDLAWHEREFTLRRSFSWIVRDKDNSNGGDGNGGNGGKYLGCAYLFPEQGKRGVCKAVTWIRTLPREEDREQLLEKLNMEFKNWLKEKIPKIRVD